MIPGVIAQRGRRSEISDALTDTIVLDFVNATYTVFGAPSSFDELLGGSTNFGSGGEFNGTVNPGVGLEASGATAEGNFIGEALTAILNGCSILFEVASAGASDSSIVWKYDEPDFLSGHWAQAYRDTSLSDSDVGDFTTSVSTNDNRTVATDNKMAVTFDDGSAGIVGMSVNGDDAVILENPQASTALNAAAFVWRGTVKKITIYRDIQPDLAALSNVGSF